MKEDLKERVMEALELGNYVWKWKPVGCIEERVRYDGSNFYVFKDRDGTRRGTDLGNLTVGIPMAGGEMVRFVYDMRNGQWSGNELCGDEEVTGVLEELDGFIPFGEYDRKRQWEVYAAVNGKRRDAPYFGVKDEGCPTDLACLGDRMVAVPVLCFIVFDETQHSKMEVRCEVTDFELYQLYRLAKRILDRADEEKVVSCPGELIEKTFKRLYDGLLGQIENAYYLTAEKEEDSWGMIGEEKKGAPEFVFMVQLSKGLMNRWL